MNDLITEARELCKYSEKIVNQLHTERLDYELEYMPLIETIQVTSELCDALEKAEEQNKQLTREVCKLACESVEREKNLARLEAEVMAACDSARWIPVTERLPMTLDELRQMDGEPVWIQESAPYTFAGYKILCSPVVDEYEDVCFEGGDCYYSHDYGDTWLAYRAKPERSET